MRTSGKQVSTTGMTFSNPSTATQPTTLDYLQRKLLIRGGWGAISAPATTAQRFLPFMSNTAAPQTAETSSFLYMPFAGTVIRVFVNVVTPLLTNSVTFKLRKNAADTAAQVTLAAATNQASLLAQAIAFAAGDRLSFSALQSSTETQAAWSAIVSIAYISSAQG